MSFIMKKKKYKFQVEFGVEELANVPFVSGVLFTKIRLLNGGNFCEYTDRAEVIGHNVCWKACFKFSCRLMSNAASGVLEPCLCRVSVRKETKGGKSYQKLGFANVDLTRFAGAGKTTLRCLLNGYDVKHRREDNSTLKISVHLTMLKGDPCFKIAPTLSDQVLDDKALHEGNRVSPALTDECKQSLGSGPAAFEWKVESPHEEEGPTMDDLLYQIEKEKLPVQGHSRNASSVSSQSKASGQIRASTHSRQPSSDSFQVRSSTCGSADVGMVGTLRNRHPFGKMDDNVLDVVNGVLRTAGFDAPDDIREEALGLHLTVAKDGATMLQTVRSVFSSETAVNNEFCQ